MQRDIHFYSTLALCKRAGYGPEEAKLIAWASWMTDESSITQVKWPWQMFGKRNPGPYFHFVEGKSGVVEANSEVVARLVRLARTPIELGIALHAFQDSYSHAGFIGRLDKRNIVTLKADTSWLRRLIPPYGHAQMLKRPDRCKVVWTDTRTGEVRNNAGIFRDALYKTYALIRKSGTDTARPFDVASVVFWQDYDKRKAEWAKLAGMPDIRFSKIQNGMWAMYHKEFKAAAKRQKEFLT